MVDEMLDVLRRHLLRRDRQLLGLVHEDVGQLHDVVAEGGGEQHRLPLVVGRQPPQQVAQVLDEPHVEHAVGFVDDEHLDAAQVEHVLAVVVDQAPRRADQQVDARLHLIALLAVVDAAVHGLDGEAGGLPEQVGVVGDLHHQLARRRDDERARARACRRAVGSSRRVKIVMRNAAVLPVPVCACPATSLPASDSGRTFSWMGVQRVKPAARMPSITCAGRSKLSKGRPSGAGVSVLTQRSLTGGREESSRVPWCGVIGAGRSAWPRASNRSGPEHRRRACARPFHGSSVVCITSRAAVHAGGAHGDVPGIPMASPYTREPCRSRSLARMPESGSNIRAAQEPLGHRDVRTAMTYTHLNRGSPGVVSPVEMMLGPTPAAGSLALVRMDGEALPPITRRAVRAAIEDRRDIEHLSGHARAPLARDRPRDRRCERGYAGLSTDRWAATWNPEPR